VEGPSRVYSICYPSDWSAQDNLTLEFDYSGWEDGLIIELPGSFGPRALVFVAYYRAGGAYYFVDCPAPETTSLLGLPATHCGWGEGRLALDPTLFLSTAKVDGYYINPYLDGRLAVGVHIDGWDGMEKPAGTPLTINPEVERTAQQIFSTLRLEEQ
jgi:hypothetical protein